MLLVGDETAGPAIEGILRSLIPETAGQAVLEVPTDDDTRPLDHPPGVEVIWVVRQPHPDGCPCAAVLEHVRAQGRVPGNATVFVAGESGLATTLRRDLVAGGHDKVRIRFAGYWKSEPVALAV